MARVRQDARLKAPRQVFQRLFVLVAAIASPGFAQDTPNRVFPPGGQRGTAVTLTFPQMVKEETATLVIDGVGLKAQGPFVKGVGKVDIAADAEVGVRQIRLVGAKLATAPRPFAVGTLPETLEVEPNDALDKAQKLDALPMTLNGAIPKPADVDHYRLALKQGQCLVIASESRRLGGQTHLALTVRDPKGARVPVNVDYRKRDLIFTCRLPADGEYLLQFADITSNLGNIDESCQYRLHLTTGPWLDYAVPPSIPRGSSSRLTVFGWNFGGKVGPGSAPIDVSAPASGESLAVGGLDAPNRVRVAVTEQAETPETEPNDTPDRAQNIGLPAALQGVFQVRGDSDTYRFSAKAREVLRFKVIARDAESLADPRLTIRNAKGESLVSEDDFDRTRDPHTVWAVPEDGSYTVTLEDLAKGSRGGQSSYYRLHIGPAKPWITVLAIEPNLALKPGAKAEWSVTVYQSQQPEDVTLHLEGLPEGVTAEPVKVPKGAGSYHVNQAKIAVSATSGAKPGYAVVRVIARTGGKDAAVAEWMLVGDGNTPLGTGGTSHLVVLIAPP